jgi:hypothetical protein
MELKRSEFQFQDKEHGPISVTCIMRGGKLREFTVIIAGRVVRLGVAEVGSNLWPCASHCERAIKAALQPKKRRTPADARRERLNRAMPEPESQTAGWFRVIRGE